MSLRSNLTIFEGPDGSGKSSAALAFAAKTNARYVHLGPFPRVRRGIGRLYVEAMLPALLGLQDVVLDRCWISEPIYGKVHRGGADRLTVVGRRMLERLAMSCATQVVLCLPPVETCLAVYRSRRKEEYLAGEEQLTAVHEEYRRRFTHPYEHESMWRLTDLPVTVFNYVKQADAGNVLFNQRTIAHPSHWSSAGARNAEVLIVGERFGHIKEYDTLQQYPFVSFSQTGCSWWLTRKLAEADIDERSLIWVNVFDNHADETICRYRHLPTIALGEEAAKALRNLGPDCPDRVIGVAHPQRAKRFGFHKTYDLLPILKELTS